MKIKAIFFLLVILACSFQPAFAQKKKNKKKNKGQTEQVIQEELASYIDSVSYAFGIVLGHNLKAEHVFDLDLDILKKALSEVLVKEEYKIESQASRNLVNSHIEAKRKEAIERNLAESTAFLEENGKRENVITTESGLQYEILVESDGEIPGIEDKVLTHYHGTLIDGTIFDSSVKRGEPLEFPLKGVIKGWTEILQIMPVGSKWRVYIPPALAYGDHGAGQKIGPNMALIFEMELLEIVK